MTLGAILASLLAAVAAGDGPAPVPDSPDTDSLPQAAAAAPEAAPALAAEDARAEAARDAAPDEEAPSPADVAPPFAAAPPGPPLSESGPLLLERVERPGGWATERLIEPSGDIVLHSVDPAGTVRDCRVVGSLLALALVEQRPAAGGEFVHLARDASGALVSYAVGPDGEPRAVAVVAAAAAAPR